VLAATLAQRVEPWVGPELDLKQPLTPLALELREVRTSQMGRELSRSEVPE
jgi:hypothetical protein